MTFPSIPTEHKRSLLRGLKATPRTLDSWDCLKAYVYFWFLVSKSTIWPSSCAAARVSSESGENITWLTGQGIPWVFRVPTSLIKFWVGVALPPCPRMSPIGKRSMFPFALALAISLFEALKLSEVFWLWACKFEFYCALSLAFLNCLIWILRAKSHILTTPSANPDTKNSLLLLN